MKVLITGASGFIGTHLTQKLSSIAEIYTIDHKPCHLVQPENQLTCDIQDIKRVSQFIQSKNPDIIIHLAAIVHKNNADTSKKSYDTINTDCSKGIFSVARDIGAYCIFASTTEVYNTAGPETIDETTQTDPQTYYAASKLAAEAYLKDLLPTNHCILRLAPTYGPTFSLNIDRRSFLFDRKIAYQVGRKPYHFNFLSINNLTIFIQWATTVRPNGTFILSDRSSYSSTEIRNAFRSLGCRFLTLNLPYTLIKFAITTISLFRTSDRDRLYSMRNLDKLISSRPIDSKQAHALVQGMTWDIYTTYSEEFK